MKMEKQNNNEELTVKGNGNIVNQNINTGLTVKEACEIAERLFEQNFPKLQQLALDTVNARINEYLTTFRHKIIRDGGCCSNFESPDYQYALLDSMKLYAKYGTAYLLNTLTEIISTRNKFPNDLRIKVAIDDAIKIAPKLTQHELNFLSLVFYSKHVMFKNFNNIDEFMLFYRKLAQLFPFNNINHGYLNSVGCYSLNIGSFSQRVFDGYHFPKKEIEEKMPKEFLSIPDDYGLTYPAIVLAIQNVKIVTGEELNLTVWIN